ncbi:hypothetical protein L9F63_010403, partial [Diploptera punctata]
MVIKSRSDTFSEIIHIVWTMKFCGVIPFTLHGEICNRDIRHSKLQMVYGILIFITRNSCFIFVSHFIHNNFVYLQYFGKIIAFITCGMNVILTLVMALNLVTFFELSGIFPKLSQFDNSVKKTKSHNLCIYGQLFIHIGLCVFTILFNTETGYGLKFDVILIIMHVFQNFIDINVAFLLDLFMIRIVVMIEKRFGIVNSYLEGTVNNFSIVNITFIRDLMSWHNLLCDTVNLTNSFFSMRILLGVLVKFMI